MKIGVEFRSNVASTMLDFLMQIMKEVKAKMPEKLLTKCSLKCLVFILSNF